MVPGRVLAWSKLIYRLKLVRICSSLQDKMCSTLCPPHLLSLEQSFDATVITDQSTGRSRAFGFVTLNNAAEVLERPRTRLLRSNDRTRWRRARLFGAAGPGAAGADQAAKHHRGSSVLSAVFGLVAGIREPFVQPILDLAVPRKRQGRVAMVGDAAFVPRPHTGASTSNAVANARTLGAAPGRHQLVSKL